MKRIAFARVVAALLPFLLFTACEDILGIFIGGNDAPIIIIYNEQNSPVTGGAVSLANGTSLTLTVNATDKDGDFLTYKWYIDGALQGSATLSTFTFSATPEVPTSYVIEVRVSDGTDVTIRTVTINVGAPDPSVLITASRTTIDFGESLVLTATVLAGLDQTALTYSWAVGGVPQSGSGSNFTFTAGDTAATVTVSVEISDGTRTGEDDIQIEVVAPSVSITPADTSVGPGIAATLTANLSSGFNPDGTSYTWYVDDVEQTGETVSSFDFSAAPGTTTDYVIKVVVSDGTNSAEDTATVTVQYASVTLSTPSTTVSFDDSSYAYFTITTTGFNTSNLTIEWYDDGYHDYYNDDYSWYYWYFPYTAGTYDVRVVVSDGINTAEDTITMTVVTLAPSILLNGVAPDNTTYYDPVTVTLSSGDPSATLYYVVDQNYSTTVTTSSTPYTEPFVIQPTSGETYFYVHVLASNGTSTSSNYWDVSFGMPTPTVDIDSGTYNDPITVYVTNTSTDYETRFSTGYGNYPTETSPLYNDATGIPLTATGYNYIYIRHYRAGWPTGSYLYRSYNLQVGAPVPSPDEGTYELTSSLTMDLSLTSATSDAVIYYSVDGSTPSNTSGTSFLYSSGTPITIAQNTTIKAIAYSAAMASSATSTSYFYLKPAAPVFSVPGGSYTEVKYVEMSSTTPGAVIRYNLSSTVPSYITSGTGYVSAVMLDSDTILTAAAFIDGWSRSDTTSATYDITVAAIDPEFIYRLNLSTLYTEVNVTSNAGIWYVVTIPSDGRYYFNFADTDEGDGTETLDGLVTIYESDMSTPLGDVNARDQNAYYSPVDLDLTAGDYYIRVYPYSSGYTGTVRIRIFQ